MPLLCCCCAPVCSNRVTCEDKKFTHWRKHGNSAEYVCMFVCLCARATAMFSDLLRPTPFSRIKKSSRSLSTTKNQAICSSIRWSVFLCENRDRKRGCLSHFLILAWDCVGKKSLNSDTTKQVRFAREAAGMHTCTCIHERTHHTQICTHTYPNEYLYTYTHTHVQT